MDAKVKIEDEHDYLDEDEVDVENIEGLVNVNVYGRVMWKLKLELLKKTLVDHLSFSSEREKKVARQRRQ